MIEQEVLYERNMTGSYMKIEASGDAEFDERMLFAGKISGILPAEQCFLNGKAWYWYNISGKQSLDTYCKVQDIGILLIEKIIISICDEIDILEWNLFDLNCLLLSPEFIFINNINQEILFTVYPGSEEELSVQFRELMEYLLTRIDHKDVRAVQAAYGIYEKTLDEAYDIMDIRDYVVMGRTKDNREQEEPAKSQGPEMELYEQGEIVEKAEHKIAFREKGSFSTGEKRKSVFSEIMDILNEWKQSLKRVNQQQKQFQIAERIEYGKSKLPQDGVDSDGIVAPDVGPGQTTVLTGHSEFIRGVLVYEGADGLESISLRQSDMRVGKIRSSDIHIPRKTISQFHAKISYKQGDFFVEDLNSTNGTYVNEEPLAYKEVRKLEVNDMVRFADVSYRFV